MRFKVRSILSIKIKEIGILFYLLQQSLNGLPQFAPKAKTDTLYFPIKENVQLVVINCYDTWQRQVDYKEAIYPRALTWASVMGPAPKNIYIFRNKEGEIIKTYNVDSTRIKKNNLKKVNYINTTNLSLSSILDYLQFNGHLMFYAENNKVGLINLKGEVIIPAIYDGIRKYQDRKNGKDKLVVEKDSMFGFLDAKLNMLFPPIYRTQMDEKNTGYPEHNIINEKYIKVFKYKKCGLINENGDVLVDFIYDDFLPLHDSLYIGVIFKNNYNKKSNDYGDKVTTCIVYAKDFTKIAELKDYDYIRYWGIKEFIVKKENKYGVFNHKGEVLVPLEYDELSPQNGDYYVFKDNKSGMVNHAGKVVLPIEFERNMYFYGDAIYVVKEGLIGVYNNKYVLIAAPQFQLKHWDMGKYILIRKDGTKGFVKHQKEGSYYQSPEGQIIKF